MPAPACAYSRPVVAVHVVRVFVGPGGRFGNSLGVVLDGGSVLHRRRQALATELGFSETVYVDDAARGEIRIFTPSTELPFAGHPSVGAAWLLAQEAEPVDALRPPAGEVRVRYEGDVTWIAARPEWAPSFEYTRVESPALVDAIEGPPRRGLRAVWAFEDEATGSTALGLAARLGRQIEIHQGRGSVIHARPLDDGQSEIGGLVTLDELRAV